MGGGKTVVRSSRFVDNVGGAITLSGGSLELHDCDLSDNHREGRGGAILVTGGHALITGSRFFANSATAAGGALQVQAGAVELANQTLMLANRAGEAGHSVHVSSSGSLLYRLPSPLGRWVYAPNGVVALMGSGATNADFPFACSGRLAGKQL